jgi:hypothetical protein
VVIVSVAAISSAVAFACSGPPNNGTPPDTGSDGSADARDGRVHGDDVFVPDSPGDDADSGCPTPADITGWTPPAYHPATGSDQGKCTDAFISAYFTDCLGPTATQATCAPWGTSGDAAHKACAQCLLTLSTAAKYGPLVEYKGVVNANIAGCIELKDPTNGVACATAVQQSEECDHAACDPVCPVKDDPSFQLWLQCVQAAEAGQCKPYADKAACANAEQDGGPAAACFPGANAKFIDYYDVLAPIFCGGVSDSGGG